MSKLPYRLIMLVLIAICSLAAQSSASATTYQYSGQPMTDHSFHCPGISCRTGQTLSGSVTFNFDATAFTGTLSMSDADVASFAGFVYPYFLPPPGVYTTIRTLTGSLTLLDGLITSWDLIGYQRQVNCGLGPGCAAGSIYAETTPTGDSYGVFNDNPFSDYSVSNNTGGIWVQVLAPAVPEPSTWAMLLIGFAGIGFMARVPTRCRSRLSRY
jgi:hypothetical protein